MSTATSFICPECQRVLRTASPVAPGKKIRCPACNTVFAPQEDARPASPIRKAEEAAYPAKRAAAELEPAPRRRPADDYEDDSPRRPARRAADAESYDDDRPRRRSARKRTPWGLIIGGSAALVLLLGFVVTAFIWPGFLRSSGGAGGGAPSAQVESLLAFMPGDPLMMAGLDLTKLEKRNQLDVLLAKLPAEITKNMPNIPPAARNILSDIETLVIAKSQGDVTTLAVRTKSAFKKETLLAEAKGAVERDVQGVKIITDPGALAGRETNFFLDPDNKLIVMSQAPQAEFAQLVKQRKGLGADARGLVQRVGGAPAWWVAQVKGEIAKGVNQGIAQMGMFAMMDPKLKDVVEVMRKAKGFAVWAESKDTVSVRVGCVCANAGDAGSFRNAVNDSWNQQKAQIRQMGPLFQKLAPAQANLIGGLLKDLEDTFNAQSDGDFAWISVTFSNNTARELAMAGEQQMQNLGGLGGFGARQPPFNPVGGGKPANVNFGDPRFQLRTLPPGPSKVVLQRNDQLNHQTDPRCEYKGDCGQKLYTSKMTAGKIYQIDVTATWDNYLYFEDEKGQLLRFDDDGGGFPNARIVFRCDRTADYRIIVTSLTSFHQGPFTLTVREQ